MRFTMFDVFRKRLFFPLIYVTTTMPILLFHCSMPHNCDPVLWKMNMIMPFIKERIVVSVPKEAISITCSQLCLYDSNYTGIEKRLIKNVTLQVPLKSSRIIKRIQDLKITQELTLSDNLKLPYHVFGLAAENSYWHELIALRDTEINPEILFTDKGRHFFPIIGENGKSIPQHIDTVVHKVLYSTSIVNRIQNTDTLAVRIVFTIGIPLTGRIPMNGVIHFADNLHLEGIGRTDSLIGTSVPLP